MTQRSAPGALASLLSWGGGGGGWAAALADPWRRDAAAREGGGGGDGVELASMGARLPLETELQALPSAAKVPLPPAVEQPSSSSAAAAAAAASSGEPSGQQRVAAAGQQQQQRQPCIGHGIIMGVQPCSVDDIGAQPYRGTEASGGHCCASDGSIHNAGSSSSTSSSSHGHVGKGAAAAGPVPHALGSHAAANAAAADVAAAAFSVRASSDGNDDGGGNAGHVLRGRPSGSQPRRPGALKVVPSEDVECGVSATEPAERLLTMVRCSKWREGGEQEGRQEGPEGRELRGHCVGGARDGGRGLHGGELHVHCMGVAVGRTAAGMQGCFLGLTWSAAILRAPRERAASWGSHGRLPCCGRCMKGLPLGVRMEGCHAAGAA
eukprot:350556-Chlamydomonas_euryale.AAC.25